MPGGREYRRDLHSPLTAHGTEMDILSCQSKHQGFYRFFDLLLRRKRVVELCPATVEFLLASAIGKEAEVTDTNKAVRHDVKQETTDELFGVESHDLLSVAVSVVLPPEPDDSRLKA